MILCLHISYFHYSITKHNKLKLEAKPETILKFHSETTQRDLCVQNSILETIYDLYAHSPEHIHSSHAIRHTPDNHVFYHGSR